MPFPSPLTIPPLAPPHQYTLILLHGRGSTPHSLLPLVTPLQQSFPSFKFILPTSPRSRATIYARSLIPQWFDGWHLDTPASAANPSQDEWRSIDGLQQTVNYLHDLLREEIALLGGDSRKVVLGGLSQGCAASLMALLLWEGESLGGYVGMCGWLPFVRTVDGVVEGFDGSESKTEDDGFDPFARDDGEGHDKAEDVEAAVVSTLRECLELDGKGPSTRPRSFDTPVFLVHGTEDDKVLIAHGREASSCLQQLGVNTSWNEYPGLGHWFYPEMITDIAAFLKSHTRPIATQN
ncbi:Alpha/Beta hydrolase protein [Triangularia verruculosa]|uniref:Alpha/Beta hydrolase protein n=1 Tax=Triangularia verruculosa TaxID=2587418 RepID=A0AAN6XLK4_9PEZI|nr:Alpha/Beta hydrolase protein [Triangularia verruculosa]